MAISRPLAAVCGTCIARSVVFPLDTLRVRSIVPTNTSGRMFDGLGVDMCGQTIGTAVFMQVYESSLQRFASILLSATFASAIAAAPRSFFDVLKKMKQTGRVVEFKRSSFVLVYLLHVAKHVPRSCVHYFAYERILFYFRRHLSVSMFLAGAVAATVGSMLTAVFIFPIDYVRMGLMFGGTSSTFVRPLCLTLLQTILSSGIGHGILESLAPRV